MKTQIYAALAIKERLCITYVNCSKREVLVLIRQAVAGISVIYTS